ncbi:hypothetical protein WH95_16415 [Kiloniella litopenaei]|uniref:Uncharacterized protein n=1 Tax=Kiloniella litopenaei TaxID=1549748 RepID=A0A0M2R2D9_9PROT|nr:hypothetical protein WH95_16415 [Kiloniella litopenaei]
MQFHFHFYFLYISETIKVSAILAPSLQDKTLIKYKEKYPAQRFNLKVKITMILTLRALIK